MDAQVLQSNLNLLKVYLFYYKKIILLFFELIVGITDKLIIFALA